MSEVESESDAPSVGESELDLLIEIRDLLKQLLDGLAAESGGR